VVAEALIVVVDLEEHLVAVGIERAKVVLFVRVVGVTKVVKHRDGLDDPGDGFGPKALNRYAIACCPTGSGLSPG